MRGRVAVPLVLVVLAVAGLVLGVMLPGTAPGAAAAAGIRAAAAPAGDAAAVIAGSDTADAGAQVRPPFDTAGAGGGVAAENQPQPTLPIEVLAPGDTPPQFVVVSFDGACKDALFKHYTDLANRTDARFTFFLTGLCLLPEDQRMLYDPPGKSPGSSAVGFADPALVVKRTANLRDAYDHGHEIGTHFLGHFCDSAGVASWDTADWLSEITQFNTILDDWAEINGVADPVPLPFNASVVKGGRTPCLAGDRDQMYPAFRDSGYTYDASQPGKLTWPRMNKYDLWEFPLQTIRVDGYDRSTLSMDYNLLVAQNGGQITASEATCDRIRQSAYRSFMAALDAVRDGNRAPFFVGNHFNEWVCGAYRDALTRFVDQAHERYPDVRFVSNADLVAWLEAQDPKVLRSLQKLPAQEY